jgi:hypothetical protein
VLAFSENEVNVAIEARECKKSLMIVMLFGVQSLGREAIGYLQCWCAFSFGLEPNFSNCDRRISSVGIVRNCQKEIHDPWYDYGLLHRFEHYFDIHNYGSFFVKLGWFDQWFVNAPFFARCDACCLGKRRRNTRGFARGRVGFQRN